MSRQEMTPLVEAQPVPDARTPTLSIVLPVYNEGERVVPVLRALEAALVTPHETLVVYDFDGDTTVPPVNALAAELPALRLVRNGLGRGVLNAMKAGIAESRGELVLVTMADGSDDPKDVERMVRQASLAPTWLPPAGTCAAAARWEAHS